MKPRRFFSDNSYWNTPLGPRVEADPDSDRLLAIMATKGTPGFWLNLDRFGLSAGARVVARALQEYGAVNTDTGGSNALYGEGLWAQPGRTWNDLLAADGLMAIPLTHYRVLRLDGIIDSGMSHRQSQPKEQIP